MTAKPRSELRLRVISGVVLAGVALAATLAGGWLWVLLVGLGAFLAFREWLAMTAISAFANRELIANGLMVLALACVAVLPSGVAGLAVLICAAALYTMLDRLHGPTAKSAGIALLYCGLAALALIALRVSEQGLAAVFILFAIVWGTDIGAYFTGRALGGPKLAPSISPGKTQSGAAGGAAAGVIAALCVNVWAVYAPAAGLAAAALLASVVAQCGDLFESWLKRKAGVKDSGRIIPGHGGVFDRIDGLIPAAITFFLIAALAGWL
ncbi:MAG: phosphatidate cytidylyltransferase [Rhizobiaceae bacterium]|jgi:phosphatidate cytidylyltransferase|nr:phosphatidate cytidylyltransferase [Rhizobiaceae bacterium]